MIITQLRSVIIPLNAQEPVSIPADGEHPDSPWTTKTAIPTQVQTPVSLKPQNALIIVMERQIEIEAPAPVASPSIVAN